MSINERRMTKTSQVLLLAVWRMDLAYEQVGIQGQGGENGPQSSWASPKELGCMCKITTGDPLTAYRLEYLASLVLMHNNKTYALHTSNIANKKWKL